MAQQGSGPALSAVAGRRSGVSQSLTVVLEELPEKNTFIDYPPVPMAESDSPPTASAPPAFLDRFKKTAAPGRSSPISSPTDVAEDLGSENQIGEEDGHIMAKSALTLSSISEELPEKNTFIDYPPEPMAEAATPPTTSAPAFLDRFKKGRQEPRISCTDVSSAQFDAGEMSGRVDVSLLSTHVQEQETNEAASMETLAALPSIFEEELHQKNTFIDYPPVPMAQPRTPTASAPAFLDRFKNQRATGKASQLEHDVSLDSSSSTECPSDSPVTEDLGEEVFCLASFGSAGHSDGNCSPCAWYWKPSGCRGGLNCTYCHLCPPGARKAIKKAKVAMLRQAAAIPKEPAYVECYPSSPLVTTEAAKALDPLDETSVDFGRPEDVATDADPVKVSVKNTFIQFEVAPSPDAQLEPPSRTAPGDFFRKFFQTREETSVVPAFPPGMPSTPTFSGDCRFNRNLCLNLSLMQATAAMQAAAAAGAAASTPVADADVEEAVQDDKAPMNGKEAHAVGQCTPCAYFWYKKDGCRKGDECEFCHRCEKGEIKKRKKHRVQHLKAVGAYIPGYSKIQEAMKQAQHASIRSD